MRSWARWNRRRHRRGLESSMAPRSPAWRGAWTAAAPAFGWPRGPSGGPGTGCSWAFDRRERGWSARAWSQHGGERGIVRVSAGVLTLHQLPYPRRIRVILCVDLRSLLKRLDSASSVQTQPKLSPSPSPSSSAPPLRQKPLDRRARPPLRRLALRLTPACSQHTSQVFQPTSDYNTYTACSFPLFPFLHLSSRPWSPSACNQKHRPRSRPPRTRTRRSPGPGLPTFKNRPSLDRPPTPARNRHSNGPPHAPSRHTSFPPLRDQ